MKHEYHTIKLKDLWKQPPGIKVVIGGKELLYLGRTNYDQEMEFYDETTAENIIADDIEVVEDWDDIEVELLTSTPDVQELIKHKLRHLCVLIDEGWVIGEEHRTSGVDLTDEVDELRALVTISRVIGDSR